MHKSSVLIVGAGVPGLSLAIMLAENGFDITVLEASTPKDMKPHPKDTRTTALMNNSIDWLRQCGVWDKLSSSCHLMQHLRIIDDSSPNTIMRNFSSHEIGVPQFGWNCPLSEMRYQLYELATKTKGLKLITGKKLDRIEWLPSHAVAHLDKGKSIDAHLIIGADGRHSVVRENAGIETKRHDYDQVAITALLQHESDHNNTSIEIHRPGGPMTFVPYGPNKSSLVWVVNSKQSTEYTQLKKEDFDAVMQEKSLNELGQISTTTEVKAFPLSRSRSIEFVKPRCALMAEAGHVTSPIGAQGLNISLRDARALFVTLSEARMNGMDVGSLSVLKQYEAVRQRDVTPRTISIDWLHRTVATDSPFVNMVRRTAFRFLSADSPLRKALMRAGLAA